MTTFLLVRHAAHDWLGRGVPARLPGVAINAEGREQARQLVRRLDGVPFAALYCSPQQRTRETLAPLAAARGMALSEEPGLDEVDFGDWTGKSFEQLRALGAPWDDWVHRRGSAQPPGGEPFAAVPARALAALGRLHQAHPEGKVLVASHGDVIKAMLARCLGMTLDDLERFDIAPVSLSVVEWGPDWRKVMLVNGWGLPQGM